MDPAAPPSNSSRRSLANLRSGLVPRGNPEADSFAAADPYMVVCVTITHGDPP